MHDSRTDPIRHAAQRSVYDRVSRGHRYLLGVNNIWSLKPSCCFVSDPVNATMRKATWTGKVRHLFTLRPLLSVPTNSY